MAQQVPSKNKLIILFSGFTLGILVVGAFQNCASSKAIIERDNVKSISKITRPAVRKLNRRPASDLKDMLRASDREIAQTHDQLDRNLSSEGGFDRAMRGVATSKETDLDKDEFFEKQDPLKIKLKTKKHRK